MSKVLVAWLAIGTLLGSMVACKTTSSADSGIKAQPTGSSNSVSDAAKNVLEVRDPQATKIYDAFPSDYKSSGASSYTGRLSFACSMQSRGLPPGAQGFPPEPDYKCSAGVPLPRGASGFPPDSFVKFDGEAAKVAFKALKASENDYGNGFVTKVYESENAVFACVNKIPSIPAGAQGFVMPVKVCTITSLDDSAPRPVGLPIPGSGR